MSPTSKKAGNDGGTTPASAGPQVPGRVAFVGAGPGDPELLTLRAARILGSADAIVVHETIAALFAAHFNPRAEIIAPEAADLVVGERLLGDPEVIGDRLLREAGVLAQLRQAAAELFPELAIAGRHVRLPR